MKAEEIKKLRKLKGWSQQRFAERIGVSITTVVRWEKGKHAPSPLAQERLEHLNYNTLHEEAIEEREHGFFSLSK